MRLLFLVPSNVHKTTAGSRIRYDRLAFGGARFAVSIQSLGDLSGDELSACDVCILSKTYSLESLAVARTLRRMGKTVGMDLFDDYFTQWDDSRLLRYRRWLTHAASVCDFAMCSTPNMRRLIQHYAPDLPVHVLPDPYQEIDPGLLGRLLSEKLARARRERVIDILWFGIGSNPMFPVGLEDVAAYSSHLCALAGSGFRPRLTILTNKPALGPERLAQLGRLPIDYRIDFWSIEAEREAVEKAFACFLPVSGQSFSRAKSLNRALTAVSSGAQVLSPAFPLYAELGPAIYQEAAELVADMETGRCRIRKENAAEISRIVGAASAVSTVADDLFAFLSQRVAEAREGGPPRTPEKIALIYGLSQDIPAVRGAKAAGVLSVASPFVRIERAYDIRVDYHSGRRLDVWITPPMRAHLAPNLKAALAPPARRGKLMMHKVEAGELLLMQRTPMISPAETRPIAQETEAYRYVLDEVARVCGALFPDFSFSVSEINACAAVPAAATLMAAQ